MNLGDLFWVKTLKLRRDDDEYKDTIRVMVFLREKFDINLSFIEAYTLWKKFSDAYYAGWLCMTDNMLKDFVGYFEFDLGE